MDWLVKHRVANVALVLIYFFAVVLPHEQVGRAINSFFSVYERPTYNMVIAGIVVFIALVVISYLYPTIKRHEERPKLVAYIVVSILLVLLCFNFLLVVNVEAIHFIQYGLLAFLLFPLFRSAAIVMSLAVLAGALDELYQYLILDNMNFYYDFNDVLLDTIGAGLGVLILKILGANTFSRKDKKWYLTIGAELTICIAIILLVAGITGYFSILDERVDHAYFTLFKRVPDGFWHYPRGPYARFHILRPIPGLILIYSIAFLYGRLDKVQPCS